MDESEDNMSSESGVKVDRNSAVKTKPKKRSLVERELETNLTARVTSPVTTGDGTSTSRYGRARRLKTESESTDSRKSMTDVLKNTPPEKSPNKVQSPVYKMHASNSPIRNISPKTTPVETFLENQIETIYQENKSLSRFGADEVLKSSPCKNTKIYIQKDLIQSREPEETVVLIKSIFSPSKGNDKQKNMHLSNIFERCSDKFSLSSNDNVQNGFISNPSVVKTLDFDNKKKKKENKYVKCMSKSDLFELEAKCMYQVGDLAWSRMGTYPFWPCIVTRDPTTGIFVKKKLFGRIERDIIHVTFFGDNGRRGWIVDTMLRKFMGLAEFESTRDRFTAEDKKKDPKLYAAFFISDKKQTLWHISVEEAETLFREPKRLRIELLNDILENSMSYKINPKVQKSGKVTRTDSDVSLSESLYDTLFSEDDGKTDDSERSKNKSRNKSLDVSEVVTACLDNMAAKTGITKIQRQSHMDRWLQKAKSNTPEKTLVKTQVPKIVSDNKVHNNKKKKSRSEVKPYNLRKSPNESHNLLAYHNEHDYSKFVSDDDNSSIQTNISDGNIENKYEFVPLEESGAGIGVITKIESLADSKEQTNIVKTIKNDVFIVADNKYADEVEFESGVTTLTENEIKNIESDHSDKLHMFEDKKKDANDYKSDDEETSECAILKENINSCVNEADSTLQIKSTFEYSGPKSLSENSLPSNEISMELDDINDVTNNSEAILNEDNLSNNKNNDSIVDSEMTIHSEKHDIPGNSLNLFAEESNVIPVNNHMKSLSENSLPSNEISMELDDINDGTNNSEAILNEDNLSNNKNNDSIVDSEMTIDSEKHDIPGNSSNLFAEESNDIPVNHINFIKEESNDSVVANIRIEKESRVNKGDNIILELNLLPKNNCDEVNINTEAFFLCQTESSFLRSIKSTHEDDIEERNNVNVNNLSEETKISVSNNLNLLSKTNNKNNGYVNDNINILNEIESTKSFHSDTQCGNSETEKGDDHFEKTEESSENRTNIQQGKETKDSKMHEVSDNTDLQLNKIVSIDSEANENKSDISEKCDNIASTNVSGIKLTAIDGNLIDTTCTEKSETRPEECYNINRLKRIEAQENKDCSETMHTMEIKLDNQITVIKDNFSNLKDTICIRKIEINTEESPKSPYINGFQETETNNVDEMNGDIENVFLNSKMSDMLNNKEIRHLRSQNKIASTKERNNPEFLKYLELRQDAVMDEHPELDEDKIITYLYQTWLYEESRKSDTKKGNNFDQSRAIKGLDSPSHKKRSRRLKGQNTEDGDKNESTITNIFKESDFESVTSESSQNSVKTDCSPKFPLVVVRRNLSLKPKNITTMSLPMDDLSNRKKDNKTVNKIETKELKMEINCITELEITAKSQYDTVNNNLEEQESEILCISVDCVNKDKLYPILSGLLSDSISETSNNADEITKAIKENLMDEIDSEASDVPLNHKKLRIKCKDVSDENRSPKANKEESEDNASINSIDSETSATESKVIPTHDIDLTNTLSESPEDKKDASESINGSFNSIDSETELTKPEQIKPDTDAIDTLDVNLVANKEETEHNNDSSNVVNSEINVTKPKHKIKHKKTANPFVDPEFLKYQELRRDALIDENPQLTQEEIRNYLYKTWLYEENSKSDLKKADVIAQSGLVKGLEQETVQPKRVKKKNKVPKEITDYFEVSPKEKSKRKTIKPHYNEDYYDLEEEIDHFEINRNIDSSPSNKAEAELTQQRDDKTLEHNQCVYQMGEVEEIDEVEMYFSELTKPKPNIFKGLLREKVCEICENTGNLVKCKSCHGMFHINCVQTESKAAEISTPMRGRKRKKKAGRKPKNSEDSGSHSDDKQEMSEENNISVEEIEIESITVDAVTLETQLNEKMKELLENTEPFNYDSYTSDDELDWNDTIAGKCEIVDVKLKRKSTDSYIDYSDFKCNNCLKDDTPICFVCKSDVSKKESKIRQRCQVAHCNKYYHPECLDHWPQTQFNAGEPSKNNKKVNEHFESLTCPRHVCHTCVSDDPRGCKTRFSGDKLARCVRCPATYHTFTKCIPAGSQILTASHIICPRHYKHRPGKVPCHVNTGWCFICALGGSLICCEYCPTSFHAECLNIDPPEGGYMCEDCETGRLPLYGEMMWVKLGHYRWWPGLILHPSEVPSNIMAVKHSQGEFVVRFFGQYDYYWVNRGRVFPFQEGDSGRISSQKSKIDAAFTTAMEHAQRACEVLKSALPNEEESMDIASSLLPPHYVKLKVNRPCGSLCGRRLEDPELSLTQCDCNPDVEDPCGPYSQCLNRMLLTECGPSCRAGDRCNNRAFEKRLYPKLVPYRTPHRGWGLKTLEDIKAGQFVIEYVGELIDEEEFKRRMRRKHEIRDENFYFLTLDKERMIDAGPKGNLARFMNHCCEPNCETQKWTVLGDVRVGLFALYDIPANSEVTFNYNLESAGIEKKRCMCGAKRCSGYIGAKPKQDESQSKKGKVPVKRAYKKRKIEESPSTVKTKSKRLGRPPKPKELTEIEKDLLIIRNATSGMSSDESTRTISSEGDSLPKPLKRKRVSFSTEEVILYERSDSPNVKRQKYNEKEVGD